jgi:hypothetical protein
MVGGAATAGLATTRLRTPATMESANLMAFMVPPSNPPMWKPSEPLGPSGRTQRVRSSLPIRLSVPHLAAPVSPFAELVYIGPGQRRLTSEARTQNG